MRISTYAVLWIASISAAALTSAMPANAIGCQCSRTQDTNARMQGYFYICCNADGFCNYAQLIPPGCTLGW